MEMTLTKRSTNTRSTESFLIILLTTILNIEPFEQFPTSGFKSITSLFIESNNTSISHTIKKGFQSSIPQSLEYLIPIFSQLTISSSMKLPPINIRFTPIIINRKFMSDTTACIKFFITTGTTCILSPTDAKICTTAITDMSKREIRQLKMSISSDTVLVELTSTTNTLKFYYCLFNNVYYVLFPIKLVVFFQNHRHSPPRLSYSNDVKNILVVFLNL